MACGSSRRATDKDRPAPGTVLAAAPGSRHTPSPALSGRVPGAGGGSALAKMENAVSLVWSSRGHEVTCQR